MLPDTELLPKNWIFQTRKTGHFTYPIPKEKWEYDKVIKTPNNRLLQLSARRIRSLSSRDELDNVARFLKASVMERKAGKVEHALSLIMSGDLGAT